MRSLVTRHWTSMNFWRVARVCYPEIHEREEKEEEYQKPEEHLFLKGGLRGLFWTKAPLIPQPTTLPYWGYLSSCRACTRVDGTLAGKGLAGT